MAITEWFVGDGGNDTTGDGTSDGTRWLTIQHALDNMITGQPNRLNIKGLSAPSSGWDFTGYGIPSAYDNTLMLQGYGAVPNDHTIATITGGGAEFINNDNLDFLTFRDLKFLDWGADTAFSLDNSITFFNCEFDGENVRTKCIDFDANNVIKSCKFHRIALTGNMINAQSAFCENNYLQSVSAANGANVISLGALSRFRNNIISLNTTSNAKAINLVGDSQYITANTIFNQAIGTGIGIDVSQAISEDAKIYNNIICGMGVGVESDPGSSINFFGNNFYWNNTTNEVIPGDVFVEYDSVVLPGNPFISTGNADHNQDDFGLTSSYLADSYPAYSLAMYDPDGTQEGRNLNTQDMGALQSTPTGGGGNTIVIDQQRRY